MNTTEDKRAMLASLTLREIEYIKLACRYPKPTEADMAEAMGLSVKTVQKHCGKVHKKLGVQCHADMFHKAVELGLVRCTCGRLHEGGMAAAA